MITKFYASRKGKLIVELALLVALLAAVAFFDIGMHGTGLFAASQTTYEKIQSDPNFDLIIDSTIRENGTLFVNFHHTSAVSQPISIAGDVMFELSTSVSAGGELVQLRVFNWSEDKYFEIKVGAHTEIVGFGTVPEYNVDTAIMDANGNTVEANIEFYKLESDTRKTADVPTTRLKKGHYDIEASLNRHYVKNIKVRDVAVESDINSFIKIDDVPADKITGSNFLAVYAIDPTAITFSDAVVTVVATGDELYKCKDWNFAEQSCSGDWVKMMDIVPGQEYTFTLTPEDPGYAETGTLSTWLSYYTSTNPTQPKYRVWNGTLTSEASAVSLGTGADAEWIVLRASPTREEKILVALDDLGVVNAQVWNHSSQSWGNLQTIATGIGTTNDAYRGVDAAYEQLTGRAVVVASNGTATPVYNIWNGTAWVYSASQIMPADGCTGVVRWVVMKARNNSNELAEVDNDANADYCAQIWNGANWINNKTLDTAPTTVAVTQKFGIEYEQVSGDALVIWEKETTVGLLWYNTYSGGVWGTPATTGLNFGQANLWVRAAAMRGSDRIMIATVDGGADVNAVEWNGTAFGTSATPDAATEAGTTYRTADVAYIGTTGNAMITYIDNNVDVPTMLTCSGSGCFSGTWTSNGTTTLATNYCGSAAADMAWVGLDPDPFSSKIYLWGKAQTNFGKCFQQYNGTTWGTWNNNLGGTAILAGTEDVMAAADRFKDTTPPMWSNNATSPTSPVTYSPTANYQSNITWTDNLAVTNVIFEHNFTGIVSNYSQSGNSGNIYYYNYGQLAAGTYYWKSYANDRANNTNFTNQFIYAVYQATPILTISSAPSFNVTYATPTSVSCSASTPQVSVQLYRNGTPVSSPDVNVLAGGVYNYTCNSTATQNYTAASSSTLLVVNTVSTTTQLYLNGARANLSVAYGNTTNATATTSAGTVQLYRNGSFVSNPEITILAAGFHNYTAINPGNENYSLSSETWFLTVNQSASSLSLITPSWNITYENAANVSCNASTPQITPQLYRNGTPVGNPDLTVLGIGSYDYTCNATATQNYTAPTPQSNTLSVNRADSIVNLTLNGVGGDISTPQYSVVNITASLVTPPSGHVEIYENGTLLDSGNSPLTVLKNYTVQGTYDLTAVYNAAQNYSSSSASHILTIMGVDTTPPMWSNNAAYPSSPATYAPAQQYQFNVTWTDNVALGTVYFEHNFTGVIANYSPTGFVGNSANRTYYYNYGPLTAGTYYWKSYAADSSGNPNATNQFSYVVDQATPILTISSAPSFNVTYATPTSVSCSASTPQVSVQLYRNGTPVSSPDVNVLAGGVYNYTCNSTATQNYTAAVSSAFLTVNKATTTTRLYLNGNRSDLGIIYGTTTNATATTSAGTVQLYRNGSFVSNPEITILAAGFHNYTAINPGNENYSLSSETWFLTVDQNTSTCSLGFAPSSPQTYGTAVNVTCSCTNAEASANLYRNGTNVTSENNMLVTLAAGDYAYVCNVSASQNYTTASNASTYTINKTDSSLTLATLPSWNVTYGSTTNISCSASTPQITPQLYRSGTLVSNPNVQLLGASTYNYTCNATATQNYTAPATHSNTLYVNQASTTTYLYLNGARSNLSVTYGNQTNATATTSNGTVQLYMDGVPVSNPDIQTLAVRTYNYTAVNLGDANFTPSSETWFLTVDKANSSLVLMLNGIDDDQPAPRYSVVNITASLVAPITGYVEIYENGTLLDSGNSTRTVLKNYTALGTYNITAVYNATLNYTSDYKTHILTITPIDTTPPTWSSNITYPASPATYVPAQQYQFNITWTDDTGLGAVYIEHNFTGAATNYSLSNYVGNITNRTYYYNYGPLAVDSYYWKSYARDGSTNNASTSVFDYAVVKATSLCYLNFIPPSSSTYGNPVNANCSCTSGEAEAKLYRNGTDVTVTENGQSVILAAGTYSYACNISQTQNYTYAENTSTYTVNQATPTLSLAAQPSWNVTYGSTTNISCSASTPQITPQLYRNGTLVSNPNVATPAAGMYDYTCNATATQNYTAPAGQSNTLSVNKAASSINLLLNGSVANLSVETGSFVNILGYIITPLSGYLELYSNETLINAGNNFVNNLMQFIIPFIYDISLYYPTTQNYTTSSSAHFINVTDTIAPIWSQLPQNQFAAYGFPFYYDVNATDYQTISYSVNDTANFAIDSSTGVITNNTFLTFGFYYLQINATDASNNANTTAIIITVWDVTPPSILNVTTSSIADSSVDILWNTSKLANSVVKYGTSSGNYTSMSGNSTLVFDHIIRLSTLLPSTTYYYVVNSTDAFNNSNQSIEYSFTTLVDTTPPSVTNLKPVNGTDYNQSNPATLSALVNDHGNVSRVYANVSFGDSLETCELQRRLFYDNFGDPNLTQWTIVLGNWTVSDGQVFTAVSENVRALIVAGDANWTNYTYYTEVRQNGNLAADLDGVLVFRYVNSANYYKIEMDVDTAGLHIDRFFNGVETILNVTNFAYESNVWYSQKILVNGSSIKAKVWKYGTLEPDWIISATDITLPYGKVGYTIYSSNTTFDDPRVNLLISDGLSGTYDCDFAHTTYIGRYDARILANDSHGNLDDSKTTYFNVNDVTPPVVTLVAPANNSFTDTNANFTFNVSDNSQVDVNCSMYVDGALMATNSSTHLNTQTTFAVSGLGQGLNKIWNVTCIDVGDNSASNSRRFNVDTLPPYANITSPPNGTTITDPTPNITFVLTDGTSSTINYRVSVDGIFTGQNGTVSNNTPTNITLLSLSQASHTVMVEATDSNGNAQNSTPITLNVVPPTVYLNYPSISSYIASRNVDFVFTVEDPSFPTLNCSLYINGVLNQTNSTTQRSVPTTFRVTGIPEGSDQTWNVTCTNPVPKTASDVSLFTIDVTTPTWSSVTETPASPATYSPTRAYQFNVTWNDNIGINSVVLEANFSGAFANYSVISNGNVYSYDAGTLAAGAYAWKMYANDSSGNSNATNQFSYTIDKAISVLNLTSDPSFNVIRGALTSVGCAANNNEVLAKLHRNGIVVLNPDVQTLAADTYNYMCNASATQNYTSANTSNTLAISKITPSCSLAFDVASPQTYGASIVASCSCTNAETQAKLYRNVTDVTATENNAFAALSAGSWDYVCNSSQTQNYTYAENMSTYAINKASSVINLTLNGFDNDVTIQRKSSVNKTAAFVTPSSDYAELYENGILMANGSSPISHTSTYNDVGVFNVTAMYPATQNYTSSFETHFITVQDTTPPAGVTDLNETATGENWIYWGWANPSDDDFNHTEIWINGTFLVNVSAPANSHNVTGLAPNTTYQIQTRTVDDAGNVDTTFVNDTAATRPSTDTTPPIIYNVRNGTVTEMTTFVIWDTDDFSNSTVYYGTNATSLPLTATNTSYVQNHTILLASLTPNTTYFYNTSSCSAGGCNTSWTYNFTTRPDTTPPVIYGVDAIDVTNSSARVVWTTDEPANSTVNYGTNLSLDAIASNGLFVTAHSINLTNLVANAMYYYNVTSCDAYENCNTTGPHNATVLTGLLPDGSACILVSECTGGFCVHGICRSTTTYCGDTSCDSGEDCASCSNDCGRCPAGGGGVPAVPIAPAPPPLAQGESWVSTPHAEIGHSISRIYATAGSVARTDLTVTDSSVSGITLVPLVGITDGYLIFTELSSGKIDGGFNLVSQREGVTTVAAEGYVPAQKFTPENILIPESTYAPKLGETLYQAFNLYHVGLEGKIRDVVFKLRVDKRWVDANEIDPDTVTLKREVGKDWNSLPTYSVDSDTDYYYYLSVSPGLSTFAIVATSPPLLCAICETGSWSQCVNGEQTRLTNDCGSHTGYTCQPVVEKRACEVPIPPAVPSIPLDIIIVPVIGLAIGSYLVFGRKRF